MVRGLAIVHRNRLALSRQRIVALDNLLTFRTPAQGRELQFPQQTASIVLKTYNHALAVEVRRYSEFYMTFKYQLESPKKILPMFFKGTQLQEWLILYGQIQV